MSKVEVSSLHYYPIKSCGVTNTEVMEIGNRCIANDRRWMVVTPDGKFVTQRQYPKMAQIKPILDNNILIVTASGESSQLVVPLDFKGEYRLVEVWGNELDGRDEGEIASQWFSDYLSAKVGLVRIPDNFVREKLGAGFGYADSYPLLVASEGSLKDLNQRIIQNGGTPVPMDRFRPNLVVRYAPPYDEDEWSNIQTGGVSINVVKPCIRCPIPQVNQETGEKGKEPIKTLYTYRKVSKKDVIFAQKAVPLNKGVIRVGDKVEILSRKTPPKTY